MGAKFDPILGALREEDGAGGGASELSDLSDVNTSTPTAGNVLRADGVDWESTVLAHSDLSGLLDDDHTIYILANGSRALTGDWDAGSFKVTAQQLESDVVTGTSPFVVASTTKVTNLNADLLDDQSGAYYLDSANFTGTDWTDLTDAGATTLHKHDHGGLDGLSDDDHTQYLLATGGRTGATSQAQDLGSNGIKADVVAESTPDAGVSVDGFTIKDARPTSWDGWQEETGSVTRTGNFTFTLSGDQTAKYEKGNRIWYDDTGDEYGVVINSSYADPTTTVTMASNDDFAMSANPSFLFFSQVGAPVGFPDWFSYTPELHARTTNPTLGSGSKQRGNFRIDGKSCRANIFIAFGTSGTDAGSGIYEVTLPVNGESHGTFDNRYVGTGHIFDKSPVTSEIIATRMVPAFKAGKIESMFAVSGQVTHAVPWAWSTQDDLTVNLTYEID